ncbi:MFS transporter [Iningainema tapete]|uniref:MFS transporter n=1 Tax=Iningainema tapete BLCC-T55 TaxID=2748662 RepID=A0A8J6XMX3_9CYAN|nr:MFS transporter [Iningainema tapete BLCC-T55]
MENQSIVNARPFLLQPSSYQVWVQALARSLYIAGHGTMHFFMPLIFVNQLGMSATVVGLSMSCGALAGVVGHFLGGYLTDSPKYGRKQTLLLSALLSILAVFMLAIIPIPTLTVANLFLGLSSGCYWTAADASVIDVTPTEQRSKAFAVLVLSDSLGSGLGIWGGGILLSMGVLFQTLFLINGLILVVFLILIQFAITETRHEVTETDTLPGFVLALKDRALQLFMSINVLFTTYIALNNSTLPLYFTNFISTTMQATTTSRDSVSIANLFTLFYVGIGAFLQLPLVQIFNSFLKVHVLMISMLLWCGGFILVWATHLILPPEIGIIAAFIILSIASAIYKAFAPTVVAELAPESLRGIYLAISYQCWSIGYFIGPLLGGWAMDQSSALAHSLWIATAVSTLFGIVMLYYLTKVSEQY